MATLGFLGFMTIVFVIIVIALIIYGLRLLYGEKDEPRNEEIVINLLSDYTDGYGLLLVKERESNKELIHITGSPRDIDYIKLKNKEFKIEDQDLFVRKDLFISIDNSAHRRISIAFPDKPDQIPEKLKNTFFGKLAMNFIEEQNKKYENKEIEEILDRNKFIIRKKNEAMEGITDITDFNFELMKESIKSRNVPEPKKKDE